MEQPIISVSAGEMAEIDRMAREEYGIPQSVLMENAGRFSAGVIMEDLTSLEGEHVAVLCGKGNNGGDGFVISRYLSKKDPLSLTIYLLGDGRVKEGAAYENLCKARDLGIEIRAISGFVSRSCSVVIDALFGTGFKGELPDVCRDASKHISSLSARRYAIDVPSGLDPTTGVAVRGCMTADMTITFALAKKGFFIGNGPQVCGKVVVGDIGFPPDLIARFVR